MTPYWKAQLADCTHFETGDSCVVAAAARAPVPTTKAPGADCPKCRSKCAEFKLRTEPFTRWSCHPCGIGGRLTGSDVPAPAPAAPAVRGSAKNPHPHWSPRAA